MPGWEKPATTVKVTGSSVPRDGDGPLQRLPRSQGEASARQPLLCLSVFPVSMHYFSL